MNRTPIAPNGKENITLRRSVYLIVVNFGDKFSKQKSLHYRNKQGKSKYPFEFPVPRSVPENHDEKENNERNRRQCDGN